MVFIVVGGGWPGTAMALIIAALFLFNAFIDSDDVDAKPKHLSLPPVQLLSLSQPVRQMHNEPRSSGTLLQAAFPTLAEVKPLQEESAIFPKSIHLASLFRDQDRLCASVVHSADSGPPHDPKRGECVQFHRHFILYLAVVSRFVFEGRWSLVSERHLDGAHALSTSCGSLTAVAHVRREEESATVQICILGTDSETEVELPGSSPLASLHLTREHIFYSRDDDVRLFRSLHFTADGWVPGPAASLAPRQSPLTFTTGIFPLQGCPTCPQALGLSQLVVEDRHVLSMVQLFELKDDADYVPVFKLEAEELPRSFLPRARPTVTAVAPSELAADAALLAITLTPSSLIAFASSSDANRVRPRWVSTNNVAVEGIAAQRQLVGLPVQLPPLSASTDGHQAALVFEDYDGIVILQSLRPAWPAGSTLRSAVGTRSADNALYPSAVARSPAAHPRPLSLLYFTNATGAVNLAALFDNGQLAVYDPHSASDESPVDGLAAALMASVSWTWLALLGGLAFALNEWRLRR